MSIEKELETVRDHHQKLGCSCAYFGRALSTIEQKYRELEEDNQYQRAYADKAWQENQLQTAIADVRAQRDALATRLVAAEEERDTLLAKKDLYEQVVGSKADLLMRLRTLEGRAIELGAARRLIQELEEENEQLWGVVKDVGMLLAADPPSDGYLARNLRKMGPHIEAAFALHKEAERDREETT